MVFGSGGEEDLGLCVVIIMVLVGFESGGNINLMIWVVGDRIMF